MKSSDIRDELIGALRLDLIGPEPGSEHEREELPHEPSRWYVGGFLVPFEAPEEQKVDSTGQEELFAAGEENGGSYDGVVGCNRPGSGGQRRPSLSMARPIRASTRLKP